MKLQLILTVDVEPCGESEADMKRRMEQVATDALNRGTITGESPAYVEEYHIDVFVLPDDKHCHICGGPNH